MTKKLRAKQGGFTLVELMVSLVIGLFIVLALTTLLININRNNTELGNKSRAIENGRFAVQLLQADIAHAGFWGGFVPQFNDLLISTAPTDVPGGVPDPCLPLASWDGAYRTNLIGIPVQAYEIPAVVPSPVLSVCAASPSNIVTNPQPNTDVLIVRYAETCAAGVGGCAAVVAGDVYFQAARCTNTTSVNYTATPSVLNTTGFTLYKRNCTTVADQHKYVSSLYYVRNYAVDVGDGIPTLMRAQFNGTSFAAAQPLVEGIQGFRVEFGIDNISDNGTNIITGTDAGGTYSLQNVQSAAIKWADSANRNSPTNRGDGLPDGVYIRCTTAVPCTPAQLMNVVAVRIHVLVRGERPSPGYSDSKTYTMGGTTLGPFNDNYKRNVFTQTVRLTNVSMRRETP